MAQPLIATLAQHASHALFTAVSAGTARMIVVNLKGASIEVDLLSANYAYRIGNKPNDDLVRNVVSVSVHQKSAVLVSASFAKALPFRSDVHA